jgi:hypothetical protein
VVVVVVVVVVVAAGRRRFCSPLSSMTGAWRLEALPPWVWMRAEALELPSLRDLLTNWVDPKLLSAGRFSDMAVVGSRLR